MIKTINLNGSEVKVTELGGDNTEIMNNSDGIIYASKLPNIMVGGDEVIAIPAGAIDGLYGTHGTVYLLGMGSVELRGVDYKITESRSHSIVGGLGVVRDYIDSNDTATLEAAKKYTTSITSELAGYIGYTDNDIYGLEVDFENNIFTRLAGAVNKEARADFDSVNAYGGRKRCNLSDGGEVLAYYGDDNFKVDGSNGQVMVEQPKFYYCVVPLKTEKIDGTDGYHLRKARYYISDTPKAGFKVHPAFVRNGTETDMIYLSAFEGSLYDTTINAYLLDDEKISDFNNGRLSSIAGAKPCSGLTQKLTRTNAGKLASNRGMNWGLSTIQSVSATQLLFLIEYASFNSQTSIGLGISHTDDGKTNMAEKTGITISLGNSSGTTSNNVRAVSFRGEENLWGNIWCWVDGAIFRNPDNINGKRFGELFISEDVLSDNINDGKYKSTKIYPCIGVSYVSAFGYSPEYDWVFIPTETNGNSTLPIGDSYYNGQAGCRVPILGGYWRYTYDMGLFQWNLYRGYDDCYRENGARLLFSGFDVV